MAWLQSHQTLARHPKTLRAAKLLDVSTPTLIGHLHCLWWWCLDYAQEGNLNGLEPEEIAQAAVWDGDPQAFVSALLEAGGIGRAGFLEHSENGHLIVHDWDDYAGLLIDRRRRNAAYKRDVRRTAEGHPKDIPIVSVPRVDIDIDIKKTETESRQKEEKHSPLSDFPNVKLTEIEYQKLIDQFTLEGTKDRIETLSLYMRSKGKVYKDHFATILAWERKDRKEQANGTARRHPEKPKPDSARTESYAEGQRDILRRERTQDNAKLP